jgi:hypothetical protein
MHARNVINSQKEYIYLCILWFDLEAKFEYVNVSKHVLEKEALVLTVVGMRFFDGMTSGRQ